MGNKGHPPPHKSQDGSCFHGPLATRDALWDPVSSWKAPLRGIYLHLYNVFFTHSLVVLCPLSLLLIIFIFCRSSSTFVLICIRPLHSGAPEFCPRLPPPCAPVCPQQVLTRWLACERLPAGSGTSTTPGTRVLALKQTCGRCPRSWRPHPVPGAGVEGPGGPPFTPGPCRVRALGELTLWPPTSVSSVINYGRCWNPVNQRLRPPLNDITTQDPSDPCQAGPRNCFCRVLAPCAGWGSQSHACQSSRSLLLMPRWHWPSFSARFL